MKNFIILILIAFTSQAFSQCKPVFTATPGPGGTVTFNLTSSPIGNLNTTEWYFGDGSGTSNLTVNPTHTYQYNYNNYEACVQIEDFVTGCYDSSCVRLNITNAAQNMACPGDAAFTATQFGTQTVFTNNSGSSNWAILDLGLGTLNGPLYSTGSLSYQYNLAGTYNVTAINYRALNGMQFTCDTFSAPVIVNNVGCNLGMVIETDTFDLFRIFANARPHVGYTNYTWYIDGAFYSNASYFYTPSYFPEGTYTISLVATGPGGCYDSLAQVVDFYYTLQCPGITFTETKLPACDDYQYDAIGMTGSNTVEWYMDNVLQSTSSSATINVPFALGSNRSGSLVTGVVYGPNCIFSEKYGVNNPASYFVDLDTSGAINTWYVYNVNNIGPVASELWDFGDGFTSTLSAPTHVYSTAGFYDLCHSVTLVNGCTYDYCYNNYFFRNFSSINPIQVIVAPNITGVNEVEETNFKLFPNPTTGMLNIESNLSNLQTVLVYNLQGQVICSKEYSDAINVFELTSGIYILELLNQQNQSVVRKLFVKE